MPGQRKRVGTLDLTLMLVFSLGNLANAATITFQPAVTHHVGTVPRVVAVADFNGDGNPDLAVVNVGTSDPGSVSILLSNGDGSFLPANGIAAGQHPISLCVADFDGDGRLDLAVGDANNTLELLLGNGDGTFQSATSFAFEGSVSSLAVGDFDGDLHADLALAIVPVAPSQPRIAVLLGNGDGTFREGASILNTRGSILASDFNGDHKVDLVVGNSILLGNGDGTFQPGLGVGLASQFGAPISAGDFNRDGKLDLVMGGGNFHGESCDNLVDVLLGNGDGTFQTATVVLDVQSNCSIELFAATGDFNGDKNPDIVVTQRSDLGVKQPASVFPGNGDGTFQPAVSFDTNSNLGWVSVADLSNDQAPDLIVVNPDDNTVSVLLNTTGADFSISASAPTPGTVSRGQSSTSTVTLNHQNTFDNAVEFSCSVQPAQSAPTCSFNPNSVTFDANGNATATLTINSAAVTASLMPQAPSRDSRPLQALWLPVVGFAVMGAGFGSNRFNRRRLTSYLLGGILFGGLILQAACGGGNTGSHGPQATTYTITVTGTSGSTQHSTTATLTVQ